MKRYVITSDTHGRLETLEAVLSCSGFDKRRDVLVHAGDWIDIGDEPFDVHNRLVELGAVMLLGNHELAHIVGQRITPYDKRLDYQRYEVMDDGKIVVMGYDHPRGLTIHQALGGKVADGSMRTAFAIGNDVLVTHAGVSSLLAEALAPAASEEHPDMKPNEAFAALLDGLVARSLRPSLYPEVYPYWEIDDDDPMVRYVVGYSGVFWYRPSNAASWHKGFKQVAGHTPLGAYEAGHVLRMAEGGFWLADPFVKTADGSGEPVYIEVLVDDDGSTEVIPHGDAYMSALMSRDKA